MKIRECLSLSGEVSVRVYSAMKKASSLWDYATPCYADHHKHSPCRAMISAKEYIRHRMLHFERAIIRAESQPVTETEWKAIQHSVHRLLFQLAVFVGDHAAWYVNSSNILGRAVSCRSTRPFFNSGTLVDLFSRLLSVNGRQLLRSEGSDLAWLDESGSIRGCNVRVGGLNEPELQISGLFTELLAISLIENIYDEEPGFFVDSASRCLAYDYLVQLTPLETFRSRHQGGVSISVGRIRDIVLCLLGDTSWLKESWRRVSSQDEEEAYGNFEAKDIYTWHNRCRRPIISSHCGQVVYPSWLDTLNIQREAPLRFRVYPGSLFHKGEKYRWAKGEPHYEIHHLTDTSSTIDADFKTISFEVLRSEWFITTEAT